MTTPSTCPLCANVATVEAREGGWRVACPQCLRFTLDPYLMELFTTRANAPRHASFASCRDCLRPLGERPPRAAASSSSGRIGKRSPVTRRLTTPNGHGIMAAGGVMACRIGQGIAAALVIASTRRRGPASGFAGV